MSADSGVDETEMQPLNPGGSSDTQADYDAPTETTTTTATKLNKSALSSRPQRARVGFLGVADEDEDDFDDDEHSEMRKKVKQEFNKMNGRSSSTHARLAQQRMSLLGKPLNYRVSKRDARFRKVQTRIYNFLERPTGWMAVLYHVLVFLLLFTCLGVSIVATVDNPTLQITCNHIVFILEIIAVLILSTECTLRIWSAGCRSRYQGHYGRLRFIRRPLCILDIVVVIASVLIIVIGSRNGRFLEPAFRGLRFIQILRMVRVDRRGNTWKLLGSVVWAHRQELLTTWYIGFLALISVSFLVFTLEHGSPDDDYKTLPDAMWYGLVTLTTVGYGDKTPNSWSGKLAAAVFAIIGISFFALPAGILGSGFALQVQQQQRQKHFARRRHPAAQLIQCLWRCYAADPNSSSTATWKPHIKPVHSPTTGSFRSNNFISRLSMKRNNNTANSPMMHRTSERLKKSISSERDLEDGDHDEKKTMLSVRLSNGSHGGLFDDEEPPVRVTKLTEAHKNAIRAVRKIKYFVARRKFKEAFRPYDVKDVIEQYSSGHADMLARIKNLQMRLDQILGKSGMERRKGRGAGDLELFDPNISLLSRVVKVERRVTLIDRKLDMLIEMYREERHAKSAADGGKEEEGEHSQESDPAPRGFMRRRGWGSYHRRQNEAIPQRVESSDTSSATSPADPTATAATIQKLPISSSHPSLAEEKVIKGLLKPSHSQSDVHQSGDDSSIHSHDRMSDSTLRAEGSPHSSEKDMESDVCNPSTSDQDIPLSTNPPRSPDTVSYASSRLSSTGSSSALDSETRI
ncbi:potassium voltage-gated channel subfamily KQT member 1-like [Lytechinus pictus]|uniref:potassium voltage-gated channel subfamily KQT member 1-like n=1 Tax=Lytechinus pictus TaxID=7653 RepID=UPI0030BA2455